MKLLDCKHFKEMLVSADNNLRNKHLDIDKLNVFPVPDGDTGTNMNMTFSHGVSAMNDYNNDIIGDSAKFFAKNMLMGARGNSGVILSQIFKGFAKSLESINKATVEDVMKALLAGSRVAYKAVMRPSEGTILTVIRETADMGEYFYNNNPNCNFEQFFEYIYKESIESLNRTPDLLPVLKETNVVDSGGAGVVAILEGCYLYFAGKPVECNENKENTNNTCYCVECAFLLNDLYKKEFNEDRFKKIIGKYSDDILVLRENNFIKVHCHCDKPGEILNSYQRFGELKEIKVDLISEKHSYKYNYDVVKEEHQKYALISVANGEGIKELFNSFNVKYIINGGQTMNPSTEQFVNIINNLDAENIIILPNNPNIILAANQAKDYCNDKNVIVIQSKTILEGVNACIHFNFEDKLENNLKNMTAAINDIVTLSLTTAIKDTIFNGIEVKKDNYIGINGKEIVSTDKDLNKACFELIDKAVNDDLSYATIIYGSQSNQSFAEEVLEYLKNKYDFEGQIINGQQDLYPLLIGLE